MGTNAVSPLAFTTLGGATRVTQFDPLTAGVSVITIRQPEGFTVPSNGRTFITATVNEG